MCSTLIFYIPCIKKKLRVTLVRESALAMTGTRLTLYCRRFRNSEISFSSKKKRKTFLSCEAEMMQEIGKLYSKTKQLTV